MDTSKIIEQITKLIIEWEKLRGWTDSWQCFSDDHIQKCIWYNSSVHVLVMQNIKENNWYLLAVTKLVNEKHWWVINHSVGSLVEILKRLKSDIENWLLKWFESQVSAEIFDNFLDHGAFYLKEWHKNEAGVIIGITFEDSIRKLSRLIGIEENWIKIDELISQLQKIDIFSWIEAKRARISAAVRTSAAHARWEEFTENDVEACLKFTKELISKMDNLQ